MKHMKHTLKKKFTLIELLVVVAIIAFVLTNGSDTARKKQPN